MNMKFSCLFSWSVGISLESWHIEQGINSDGAFRIFSHANRFKKIVATLASQVHCVTNVVQHARKIHMPCVCFVLERVGAKGPRGNWGRFAGVLKKLHDGHVILFLHAGHENWEYHARHVIPRLHARHAIHSLHARHVIPRLHARHVIPSLHARHVNFSC